MSFPRYPKTKPSGVEWLGDVPEHWAVIPLGKVTVSRCDGPFGSGLKSEHYTEAGVRVIRLQNIRHDGFNGTDEAFIDPVYSQSVLSGHDVIAGDVLIAGLGDDKNSVGRACVAPAGIEPAMVKADCFRYRLDTAQVDPAFIAVQLSSNSCADAGVLSTGSTRSRIPLSVMATRRLTVPPLSEQSAIAAFLDHETGKIDVLVEEQRRLIALLKEKRQAVISHAVTKGLNPHAPLKPSGVEWLGGVPEHWEAIALKRLIATGTSISYGIVQPGEPLNEGIPFVQTTNMTTGSFGLENLQRTTLEIAALYPRSRLTGGEVILGIRASIGAAHVVPETLSGANLSRGVARIVPNNQITSRYLVAFFGTGAVSRYWQLCKQGSTFNEVSIETVRELTICVPPIAEQTEITEYVAFESKRFDTLTAEAERAIELLKERRTALISAAVTGKIDVRSFTQNEAA